MTKNKIEQTINEIVRRWTQRRIISRFIIDISTPHGLEYFEIIDGTLYANGHIIARTIINGRHHYKTLLISWLDWMKYSTPEHIQYRLVKKLWKHTTFVEQSIYDRHTETVKPVMLGHNLELTYVHSYVLNAPRSLPVTRIVFIPELKTSFYVTAKCTCGFRLMAKFGYQTVYGTSIFACQKEMLRDV